MPSLSRKKTSKKNNTGLAGITFEAYVAFVVVSILLIDKSVAFSSLDGVGAIP